MSALNLSKRTILSASRYMYSPVRCYSEGSTGAPRAEGQGDAFSKREKAQEDLYVRQKEQEKINAFKEQLKKHKESVNELEEKIGNLENK